MILKNILKKAVALGVAISSIGFSPIFAGKETIKSKVQHAAYSTGSNGGTSFITNPGFNSATVTPDSVANYYSGWREGSITGVQAYRALEKLSKDCNSGITSNGNGSYNVNYSYGSAAGYKCDVIDHHYNA